MTFQRPSNALPTPVPTLFQPASHSHLILPTGFQLPVPPHPIPLYACALPWGRTTRAKTWPSRRRGGWNADQGVGRPQSFRVYSGDRAVRDAVLIALKKGSANKNPHHGEGRKRSSRAKGSGTAPDQNLRQNKLIFRCGQCGFLLRKGGAPQILTAIEEKEPHGSPPAEFFPQGKFQLEIKQSNRSTKPATTR